jgi:hypothetical protein
MVDRDIQTKKTILLGTVMKTYCVLHSKVFVMGLIFKKSVFLHTKSKTIFISFQFES